MRYIKQNDPQSAYTLHILNTTHEYGPINIMSLLKHINKGPLLNSSEEFYIQSHYHHNKLIQKQNTGE
jgi:hypothetical protein